MKHLLLLATSPLTCLFYEDEEHGYLLPLLLREHDTFIEYFAIIKRHYMLLFIYYYCQPLLFSSYTHYMAITRLPRHTRDIW